MEKKEFKGIMELLVPSFIDNIIKEKKIDVQEAITLLYSSKLYEKLENEETKLWHLSVPTLMEMLNEELSTGNITYPEEV